MHATTRLLLLFALVCLATDTLAIPEIISDVTNINIINSVPTSRRIITMKCSRNDWQAEAHRLQITSPSGETQEASLYCGAYVDKYTGSVVGYVPDEGILYEHQVCTADMYQNQTNTIKFDPYIFISNNATQLQEMREARTQRMQLASNLRAYLSPMSFMDQSPNFKSPFYAQAFFTSWSDYKRDMTPNINAASVTKGGVILLASLAAGPAAPAVALIGIMTILNFGGTPGLSQLRDQIEILNQRLSDVDRAVELVDQRSREYEDALNEFAVTFTDYRSATGSALESIFTQATIAQDTAEIVGTAVQLLREEFVKTRDSQLALTETLHKQTTLISARTNQLSGNIETLSGIVAGLSAETAEQLQELYDMLLSVSQGTRENFEQIVYSMNNQTASLDTRIRQVTKAISNTQTALVDAINKRDTMRQLSFAVHARMNTLGVLDRMTPMLTTFGVPPDPLALVGVDGTANQPIDVIDMFSIRADSGGFGAVQDTITMVCDMYYLMELRSGVTSWRDVTDAIGPMSCSGGSGASNSTNICQCHVVVERRECTLTGVPARDTFLDSNRLVGSMCTGGTVSTIPKQTLWSSRAFTNEIASICVRGVFTGTKMRVASTLRRAKYQARYVADVCTMDFGTIQAGLVSGVSMPYLLLQFLQYGMANAVIRTAAYDKFLVGTLPGGLTYTDTPVDRQTGDTKQCVTASFMAYNFNEDHMLPVIAYQKTSAGAQAVLTLNNATYSLNTDVIYSRLLSIAPDAFVSVGEPYQPGVAYDIPQGLLPIVSNPNARRGTITYAMMPSLTGVGGPMWVAANAADFDAYAGSVTADAFRTNLSPDDRCLYEQGPSTTAQYETSLDNSVCRIKENARFYPSVGGTSVDAELVSSVEGEFYIIQVEFPEGSVAGILYTDCPVATVTGISPTANDIVLANPTTQEIVVDVHIDGRCVIRYDGVRIPASSTYKITLRDCPTHLFNHTSLSVYTLGEDARLCSGFPMDVTVNRTTFVATYGTVDPVYVSKVQVVIEDRLAQVHLASQLAIADAVSTMTNFVIDMALLSNLSIPAIDLSGFTNATNAARALARKVIEERDNFTRAYDELEDLYDLQISEFNKQISVYNQSWDRVIDQYNDLRLAAAEAELRSRTSLNDLAAINARMDIMQERLSRAEANYFEAIRNYTRAQQAFDRAVVGAFESLLGSSGFDFWAIFMTVIMVILFICVICIALQVCSCAKGILPSSSNKGVPGTHWDRDEEGDDVELYRTRR